MNDGKFPYSIGPEDNPIQFHMPVVDQIIKYKDDEKFQKAPPILPFELERINEVLGDHVCFFSRIKDNVSKRF